MQIYLVGGYVRDHFLRQELHYDIPEGDRDWVVVGSTPKEMRAKGFLPIGKDFPVFLDPKKHEEYALARTERKIAPGYHGFRFHAAPEVTLEEDLKRRDLTINAIAMQGDTVFDPYHGICDIRNKVLRHVSDAFEEDPVRILRVARFSAKLPEFSIAPETMNLMRQMVVNGEADALVPERVFLEMRKAFTHAHCDRFIQTLYTCGLGQKLFQNLNLTQELLAVLNKACLSELDEAVKFAILTSNVNSLETLNAFFDKFKPSSDIMDLCRLWLRSKDLFISTPEAMNTLFQTADAFRRPERFQLLLCLATVFKNIDKTLWNRALKAALSINAGEIASRCLNKKEIPLQLNAARIAAIKDNL